MSLLSNTVPDREHVALRRAATSLTLSGAQQVRAPYLLFDCGATAAQLSSESLRRGAAFDSAFASEA